MSDIHWREFSLEDLDLLEKHPERSILVETSVGYRVSWAQYMTYRGGHFILTDYCERALRFAFID